MASAATAAAAIGAAGKKEAAHALRWVKRFAAVKPLPLAPAAGTASVDPATGKVTFTGRYTNFSLQHIWEKYDYLQTHLLLREVIYSQLAQNPRLMDLEINSGLTPTVYTRVPDELTSSLQHNSASATMQSPPGKTTTSTTSVSQPAVSKPSS